MEPMNLKRQKLEKQQAELSSAWRLKSEKLNQLRQALAIEAATSIRFQIENQIEMEELELKHLAVELEHLDRALFQIENALNSTTSSTVQIVAEEPILQLSNKGLSAGGSMEKLSHQSSSMSSHSPSQASSEKASATGYMPSVIALVFSIAAIALTFTTTPLIKSQSSTSSELAERAKIAVPIAASTAVLFSAVAAFIKVSSSRKNRRN